MNQTKLVTKTAKEAVETKSDGFFSGYASTYAPDSVGDRLMPGAFKQTIKDNPTPVIFFNHMRYEVPIGKITLMEERKDGLYVEGQLTLDLPRAQEVRSALIAGTVKGMSISFRSVWDDWQPNDFGGYDYKKVSISEISLCTFPCNPEAVVEEAKSGDLDTIRGFEKFLRDSAGLSKTEAQVAISKFKACVLRDASRRDSDDEPQRDSEDSHKQELDKALDSLLNKLGANNG